MPDTKTLLLLFAGCHLAAMSSVITNPIMYGLLNGNFKQVDSLVFHAKSVSEYLFRASGQSVVQGKYQAPVKSKEEQPLYLEKHTCSLQWDMPNRIAAWHRLPV